MTSHSQLSNFQQLGHLNELLNDIQNGSSLSKRRPLMDLNNEEVRGFFKSLDRNEVRYMMVGGMATVYYGFPLLKNKKPEDRRLASGWFLFMIGLSKSHISG